MRNTTTKLRDCKGQELKQLSLQLPKFAVICGIREPLTDEINTFTVKFLKENYKDLSVEEIELAFIKYIRGDLNDSINPFGIFSPKFISDVLKDYRRVRNKEITLHNRLQDEEIMKESQNRILSDEEKSIIETDYLNNVLFNPYQKAMDDKKPLYFDKTNSIMLFKKFHVLGKIDISPQDKLTYNLKATKHLNVNNSEYKKLTKEEKEQTIREYSCVLFFNDWIRGKLSKGFDLREYYEF